MRRHLPVRRATRYVRRMFDISGDDVARLSDDNLRTLVARLVLAELAAQDLPRSAVTAGGHQDAKDGGVDVRVETSAMKAPDFVPRPVTAFQVKRPDMPASEIVKEMCPNGVLRPAIAELAAQGGAYIIVSAQGSVADQPLKDRRDAMRRVIEDSPDADKLHTDFYDRDRLATWVNQYAGAAAWVRSRLGTSLSGWRAIGTWSETETAAGHGYLVSEDAHIVRERTGGREKQAVAQGVDEIRAILDTPRQCIRLVGMSGVGKTRLVEALFENGVGIAAPLDPALSVYTDFADEGIAPSAHEMARRLVDEGQRAILIVDNCNPPTHARLAEICRGDASRVSLLTVEYDVHDDEPERTEVFRLTSGSASTVETWIRREFPHVSQVDRRTIAAFSDGNFRVARALAETLERGETLGRLRNEDLFQRLFHQRQTPNQQLLHDAQILALVYSFDGEDDGIGGELGYLGTLAGRTIGELFGATAELRAREIVQSRGRWRAVLPQAIANRLAANAMSHIPPGTLDAFWQKAPTRLLSSMSRRLGYLHDSAEARAAVMRWLDPGGPLGNLFEVGDTGLEIVANFAPALPEAVLGAMEREIGSARGSDIVATTNRSRGRWVRLLKALAYVPETFERASLLIARFAAAEPEDHRSDAARDIFAELFHIHLSGTHATPQQRREVVRILLASPDADMVRVGGVALDALLKTSHFSSSATFDFGARPRDFGWAPKSGPDSISWFGEAIDLAVRSADCFPPARALLGRHVRGLWRLPTCRPHIEAAADAFLANGGWIDGWIGLRTARRWDSGGKEDTDRERIEALIERLGPSRSLDRARAIVLSRSLSGLDIVDGDAGDRVDAHHRAGRAAKELGSTMAVDAETLSAFLSELCAQQAMRAFDFGEGLAAGTDDTAATWRTIVEMIAAVPREKRNPTVIGGFLSELHRSNPDAANAILESIMADEELRYLLPYLQSRAALDAKGLDRLRRLAETRTVHGEDFGSLACGVVEGADPDALIALLDAMTALERGIGYALDILYMRLACARDASPDLPPALIAYGRALLVDVDLRNIFPIRDFGLGELAGYCFTGADSADSACLLCERLDAAIKSYEIYAMEFPYLIGGLFKAQPLIALDCFIGSGSPDIDADIFEGRGNREAPLEKIGPETLVTWAEIAPEQRYPRLGRAIPLFTLENLDEVTGLSDHFIAVLKHAPDKAAFLGNPYLRIHPSGWAGDLSDHLERRKKILGALADLADPEVNVWLEAANEAISNWIASERERESSREESFE